MKYQRLITGALIFTILSLKTGYSQMKSNPNPPAPTPASSTPLPTGVPIIALPDSLIEINGDSTLKKFSSKATKIDLRATLPAPTATFDDALSGKMQNLEITLPISQLKSGDEKLDNHMSEALKGNEFPVIRVSLKSYQIKEKRPGNIHIVSGVADFSVAGKTVQLPVEATVTQQGEILNVEGEKPLLMTDFGIDPPTMMLGTLRTKNEVLVHYQLKLTKGK